MASSVSKRQEAPNDSRSFERRKRRKIWSKTPGPAKESRYFPHFRSLYREKSNNSIHPGEEITQREFYSSSRETKDFGPRFSRGRISRGELDLSSNSSHLQLANRAIVKSRVIDLEEVDEWTPARALCKFRPSTGDNRKEDVGETAWDALTRRSTRVVLEKIPPFSFVSLEMVKNNLNRRNPTYVTTLQNTHLRAHVTRHDQQRIPPIEYP